MFAAAAPVTFRFDTTVAIQLGGVGWPAGTNLGAPIEVAVSFDNAATALVVTPNPGGTRTDFDPASLSITYTAAGTSYTRSATASSIIRMRDNAPDPDPIYFPQIVDGLTFLINDEVSEQWQLTLRGPTLDLITGGALPTFQDARWDNQRTAVFEICRYLGPASTSCDNGFLGANVNAVPEPVSLALVATALTALTASRRRRPRSA